MGYGKLSIWTRFADNCSLVKTCWQTDLRIKTCGGKYLVDMDPTVLDKLKAKYPDYVISKFVQSGDGEPRIRIRNDQKFNFIEVDVPPGCYIVSTRSCIKEGDSTYNFETNKVMVLVNCGESVCVNLLLNNSSTCVKEMIYPGALLALKKGISERESYRELELTLKKLMEIAEIPKEVFISDLQQELEDLKYLIDIGNEEFREYLEHTKILLEIVNSL